MKANRPSRRGAVVWALTLAVLAAAAGVADGTQELPETVGPPWPEPVVGTLRSFFERVDVEALLEDLRRPPPPSGTTIGDGWEAPFRWVQAAVAFEPYTGSRRGASGTQRALAGNALDQALLLRDLYATRGTRTRLVRGRLSWDDSVRLVGPSTSPLAAGDPWLRLVEQTSDHWWIELARGNGWVALDPTFPDSGPDRVRGTRRQVLDEVPPSLQTVVEIVLVADGRRLLSVNRTAAALGDATIRAFVAPAGSDEPEVTPDGMPLPDAPDEPDGRTPEGQLDPDPDAEVELDPVQEALPVLPDGDLRVVVSAAGAVLGRVPVPPSLLAELELRVRVSPPLGASTAVTVPWDGGPWTTIAVYVGQAHAADSELRTRARGVYRLLEQLAEIESATQAAFLARPNPDAPRRAPRLPPRDQPVATEEDDEEEPLDPWIELHVAAIEAWRQFETVGVDALGASLMATVDRLAIPGRIWRAGVRLVALRWAPPGTSAGGRLAVWADDPVFVRGADAESLQAAHDLLYSALLGQVLNRFADRPPVSAFDVTLRTVGTGSRLNWWRDAGTLPASWEATARSAADVDLGAGDLVAGPAAPIAITEPPLLGWWSYARRTGQIRGRVMTSDGVAQAAVAFVEARDLADLESILASLADLHEASRWLARAGDPETFALAELVPRACAATALVRDLMLAGAPEGWRDPGFETFCLR